MDNATDCLRHSSFLEKPSVRRVSRRLNNRKFKCVRSGKTAGPTFPVSKVEVAIVRCPANRAIALQNSVIEEYRPRLNTAANPDAEK